MRLGVQIERMKCQEQFCLAAAAIATVDRLSRNTGDIIVRRGNCREGGVGGGGRGQGGEGGCAKENWLKI
jgi:hypothetical protein